MLLVGLPIYTPLGHLYKYSVFNATSNPKVDVFIGERLQQPATHPLPVQSLAPLPLYALLMAVSTASAAPAGPDHNSATPPATSDVLSSLDPITEPVEGEHQVPGYGESARH
ncbi:hypothetical protein VTO73DRAFT_6087 [Trametes versicolor]